VPVTALQGGSPSRTAPAEPQIRVPGPGNWEWWNDVEVQRDLGLTQAKVNRIDSIYRNRSARLQPTVERYKAELKVLDEMTRAASADEATYRLQVLQVEALRSEISLTRTVMLYGFFRELQPEQHRKLQDIFAKRAAAMMRDRGTPRR
jgi:Spy/CpxP family protein refolding chaperone